MSDVREPIDLPEIKKNQSQTFIEVYNALSKVVRILEEHMFQKAFIIFDTEVQLDAGILSALLRWTADEIRQNNSYNQLTLRLGTDPVSGFFMLEIRFYDESRHTLRANGGIYTTCYGEERRIRLQ